MHLGKQSKNFRDKKISNYAESKNMFGSASINIDFASALKSVNNETYYFTNFFPNKKIYFRFVKTNIKSILYGNIDLMDEESFEMKLVNLEKELFIKLRVQDILQQTHNKRFAIIPELYKFKELKNKELQYYIEKKDASNFEVKFIDIYHLVIPAADKAKGETEEHSQEKYEDNKNNTVCLSEIKKELGI